MSEPGSRRGELLRSIDAAAVLIAVRAVPLALKPLLSSELTIQQLKTLSVIVTATGGMTGSDLAASFGVSLASMSKLLDRLHAAGLIERRAGEGDRRVRLVTATDLGRTVVRRSIAARPEFGADILEGLDDSELAALERSLLAINRELRLKLDGESDPRHAGIKRVRGVPEHGADSPS